MNIDTIRTFVLDHVEDIQREFKKSEIRTYAASSAYCLLMSALPALLIASAILPFTPVSESDLVSFILVMFPDSSESLITRICHETYRAAGGILPVSIVFLLWSAGFGMMQLTKGLNTINDVQEKRNYFLLRLVGTFYMLLVFSLAVAMLVLQIFARQLLGLWESVLPYTEPPEIMTSASRYILLFAASLVLFLLLFTTMPATKKKPMEQLPGAIVAAGGWEVLSILFTLYARFSPHLNSYYGSLTTVVVLMFWIYWCLYIMLFGAYVNRFIEIYVLPIWNQTHGKGKAGKASKPPATTAKTDAAGASGGADSPPAAAESEDTAATDGAIESFNRSEGYSSRPKA